MDWLNKMERKFGRYAIHNLTLYLIICYVIGYIIWYTVPNMILYLTLDPSLIVRGQVWRLISWVLIPPGSFDILTVIMLFFYYSIGTSLERAWGTFRYNVYIFSGIIFTVIGAFILFLIYPNGSFLTISLSFSTYYINMSIFLAYAMSYPDMQVLLYMVIPIRIKWLAYADIAYLEYMFWQGNLVSRVAIGASLLNFIVFYFATKNFKPYTPKEFARKQKFRKEVKKNPPPSQAHKSGPRHRCAVCGRTELDDPNLEFRYCSKCNGNYEYCQDHLFTHEHKK